MNLLEKLVSPLQNESSSFTVQNLKNKEPGSNAQIVKDIDETIEAFDELKRNDSEDGGLLKL